VLVNAIIWIAVGEFTLTGNVPMNSKTVTVYTYNKTVPVMLDDRDVEIKR
jgi:hypothetical protein